MTVDSKTNGPVQSSLAVQRFFDSSVTVRTERFDEKAAVLKSSFKSHHFLVIVLRLECKIPTSKQTEIHWVK